MLTFANRPELRKKAEMMSAYNDMTRSWLRSYSYHCNRVQMPTWLISSGLKTRESHRAWRIEGHCELERESDILQCIGATTGHVDAAQQATVVMLDIAAIIHMVQPIRAKTFSQYVIFQIVPFLESQVTNGIQRMDAVWDSYPPEDNLKAHSQQRRGNRPRTRVGDGSTPIPKSEWNSGFLKNEDNKKELFSFISRKICKSDVNGTLLLSTYFEGVLTNRNFDVSGLQPCNQAEADTQIVPLHLANAAVHGHSKAYVRTVDSDIVVLALRFFDTLGLSEL